LSFVFKFLLNSYSDYQKTVCDVQLLNETIFKPWPYLKFEGNYSLEQFSEFACENSLEKQLKIFNLFNEHFLLPAKIRNVIETKKFDVLLFFECFSLLHPVVHRSLIWWIWMKMKFKYSNK